MKPKKTDHSQGKLFQSRISSLINPTHPLKILADKLEWTFFEKEFGKHYKQGGKGCGLMAFLARVRSCVCSCMCSFMCFRICLISVSIHSKRNLLRLRVHIRESLAAEFHHFHLPPELPCVHAPPHDPARRLAQQQGKSITGRICMT